MTLFYGNADDKRNQFWAYIRLVYAHISDTLFKSVLILFTTRKKMDLKCSEIKSDRFHIFCTIKCEKFFSSVNGKALFHINSVHFTTINRRCAQLLVLLILSYSLFSPFEHFNASHQFNLLQLSYIFAFTFEICSSIEMRGNNFTILCCLLKFACF